MTYYGFAGKELYVDLTTGEIRKQPLDLEMAEKFLGGMGIQLKLLYDLLKPGTDPLSPENPIIIGAGPLVGTNAPGSPRVTATIKFPENGAIASGSGAMRFGCMLKWAGYDHVVITGKSSKPVYLAIMDEKVEIRDASHLWGKGTAEVTEALWREHGDCGVIAMGEAGENKVFISLAMIDMSSTIGRGGLPAIMGSKNLKAIVAKGTGEIKIADPARFKKTVDELVERVKRYPLREGVVKYGMMLDWEMSAIPLFAPAKYYSELINPDRINERFGAEAYKKCLKKTSHACPTCLLADKETVEVKEGSYKGLKWTTSSYVAAAHFGSRVINPNIESADAGQMVKFGATADDYGIDVWTFAQLLDFIIFLYEKRKIKKKDVGGLPLTRDINTLLTWLDKVAFREGFGDVVADGWYGLVKRLGSHIVKEAHVNRGKPVYEDPRLGGMGTLHFARWLYPRGSSGDVGASGMWGKPRPVEQVRRHAERMGMSQDRIDITFSDPLKVNVGRLSKSSEDWLALLNCLGICVRGSNARFYHVNTCAELYSAATGIEVSPEELMKRVDRVWNLLKMVNIREGLCAREEDEPPDWWFEPLPTYEGKEIFLMDQFNTRRLTKEDCKRWLKDYYDEHGWDTEKGIPTKEKLTELGLEETIADLDCHRA